MENFKNMKYMVVTYGCQMNVHDSEKIAGICESLGMTPTTDKNNADYIIFNTCCIREGAEDKAFSNICALKPIKKRNPNLHIIVCGCMPQQKEGKYDLKEKLDFVDIIIGTHNLNQLSSYILRNKLEGNRIYEIFNEAKSNEEILHNIRDDKFNAYVNIMYGCNNFCTYCIVPYVRGRERSRTMKEIVAEVKNLVQREGYKYITLLGQNVNSYGNDFHDGKTNFANLLRELCKIEGDFKIKFMTSHPKDFSDELIKVIKQNNKISRSIHLPVQSGNDTILKAMNRKYTRKQYLRIVHKLHHSIKNVTISTDIIAGFPGETQKQFNDTKSLMRKVKFTQVFAFIYSRRTGTPAANFENQIPYDIKNYRCNQLLALYKQISDKNIRYFKGKKFRCLLHNDDKGGTIAETDFGKPIYIKNDIHIDDPYFAIVQVTNFQNGNLYGVIKKEATK